MSTGDGLKSERRRKIGRGSSVERLWVWHNMKGGQRKETKLAIPISLQENQGLTLNRGSFFVFCVRSIIG
jgi:hypothetical protein